MLREKEWKDRKKNMNIKYEGNIIRKGILDDAKNIVRKNYNVFIYNKYVMRECWREKMRMGRNIKSNK